MKLTCYAPGDGALSFSYIEERFDRNEGCLSSIATGDPITKKDIDKFLKDEKRFKDYLIIQVGKPIETQEMRRVEIKPDSTKKHRGPKPKDPHHRYKPKYTEKMVNVTIPPMYRLCAPVFRVGPNELRLKDTVYTYEIHDDWPFIQVKDSSFDVKNLSTLATLRWFLNNEEMILLQYPQQDETTNSYLVGLA